MYICLEVLSVGSIICICGCMLCVACWAMDLMPPAQECLLGINFRYEVLYCVCGMLSVSYVISIVV